MQANPPERLKVAVRLLPPDLSEQAFLAAIGPLGLNETCCTYHYYVSGKVPKPSNSLSQTKAVKHSRAYAGFRSIELLTAFQQAFAQAKASKQLADFGSECTVELAPCQLEMRPSHVAIDSPIHQDPDFLDFVEKLAKPDHDYKSKDTGPVAPAAVVNKNGTVVVSLRQLDKRTRGKERRSDTKRRAKPRQSETPVGSTDDESKAKPKPKRKPKPKPKKTEDGQKEQSKPEEKTAKPAKGKKPQASDTASPKTPTKPARSREPRPKPKVQGKGQREKADKGAVPKPDPS